MSTVIELDKVSLTYGPVRALDGVSLTVGAGEVLALVGDNGAGKSSLVKVITGYAQPTGGHLRIGGARVSSWTPRAARNAGIGVVYQDLALVDDISLWRNLFLGNELRHGWMGMRLLARGHMQRDCHEALVGIGLAGKLSPKTRAEVLSGGERQSLAISRAVKFGSIALVLDEPVAALALKETRRVFEAIARARQEGLGIIYVDHNMANVHNIADRIAVIEAGQVKALVERTDISLNELVGLVEIKPPE